MVCKIDTQVDQFKFLNWTKTCWQSSSSSSSRLCPSTAGCSPLSMSFIVVDSAHWKCLSYIFQTMTSSVLWSGDGQQVFFETSLWHFCQNFSFRHGKHTDFGQNEPLGNQLISATDCWLSSLRTWEVTERPADGLEAEFRLQLLRVKCPKISCVHNGQCLKFEELLLLLHCTLDGDACCPHKVCCPPQLLQVAIELVPQKRRIGPCVPPHSIM